MISNISHKEEEYMHVKTTPNLPLREAVRMSSAYPGQWPYNNQRKPVAAFIYFDNNDAWCTVMLYIHNACLRTWIQMRQQLFIQNFNFRLTRHWICIWNIVDVCQVDDKHRGGVLNKGTLTPFPLIGMWIFVGFVHAFHTCMYMHMQPKKFRTRLGFIRNFKEFTPPPLLEKSSAPLNSILDKKMIHVIKVYDKFFNQLI